MKTKRDFYSKADDNNITPVVTYNLKDDKALLLKDNKDKCGIYRIINRINNKSYIGSANNLRTRFYVYYSSNRLNNSNMIIYKAIIKYGYKNFTLDILEYCDSKVLLEREQYYIDNLKPIYNTLTKADSSIGYKHTSDTLDKFKLRKISDTTRINLAKAATNRILDFSSRIKISLARKGVKLSDETKSKLSAIAIEREGVRVEVTNILTNEVSEYATITLASISLGVSRTAVRKCIITGKSLKKTYIIKSKIKK
jgi:group I intron endonuclease